MDRHQVTMEAAQDEADRLHQAIETIRQRNRTGDANAARPRSEEASATRQQAKLPQLAAKTPPQSDAPPKPAPPATGAVDPASPGQQLVTARQWLAAGRPGEARRLLAMAQTQLVLQPVTPDAPEARGTSQSAGAVGNAIRWLDLGSDRLAMQAINQAMQAINQSGGNGNQLVGRSGPVTTVPAWSGYPVSIYSGYSQPYDPGAGGKADQR
jgi:hypothetical protein